MAAVLLALVVVLFLTKGPPPPRTLPPRGMFAFAALGDAPYNAWERLQYHLVITDIRQHDLRFVLHVGDIFWHPCTDDMYLKTRARFAQMGHPVIYTPGDNEWTDCWDDEAGRFSPLERLRWIRQIFFARQVPGVARQPEFIENLRWQQDGFIFATVHLVDSMNGMRPFPARTAADDLAVRRRTDAATSWMQQAFALARSQGAKGAIIAFHADARLEMAPADRERQVYEPFIATLEQEVEHFDRPVLVIHGGGHTLLIDHPLVSRTTHHRLKNLTRLEVPGSPDVGWVWVGVAPNAPSPSPFVFEPTIFPRWKFW